LNFPPNPNDFQLNIVARAPMDLMAQSKEIVLQHQELRGRHREMAAGVAEATLKNQELLALLKDRDEQYVSSGALRQIVRSLGDLDFRTVSKICFQSFCVTPNVCRVSIRRTRWRTARRRS